jgi:hypothetical protein
VHCGNFGLPVLCEGLEISAITAAILLNPFAISHPHAYKTAAITAQPQNAPIAASKIKIYKFSYNVP